MLKIGACGLALCFSFLFPTAAQASCYRIHEKNSRNFCRGVTEFEPRICRDIEFEPQRLTCLAVASRSLTYCYQISKNDDQQFCLAMARKDIKGPVGSVSSPPPPKYQPRFLKPRRTPSDP